MGKVTKSLAACYSDSELHVSWSLANRKGTKPDTESEFELCGIVVPDNETQWTHVGE